MNNENKANININADLSKPLEDITKDVIIPPSKELSAGITKLLSVVITFIDNATYKYIANSQYKKQKFLDDLEKKYSSIPDNNIVEPSINILGSVMDILKYNLDEDYLVEMYTNILISDMDVNTKNKCHICFVEILKQLSKNDLKVLEAIYKMEETKSMAFGKLNVVDSNNELLGYEFHNSIYLANIDNYRIDDYNQFSNSIENLNRLGLIEISYVKFFGNIEIYNKLVQDALPSCSHILQEIRLSNPNAQLGCEKGLVSINNLGYDLMQICLRDI